MNKNSNKTILALIAILIVILLIISSVFVFYQYNNEEKTKSEEPITPAIDNRVNPDISQGLHVYLLRIRNRGLLDRMVEFGNSWKETPSFYWKATCDGKENNADGVIGLGSSGTYVMWDTMGLESRCNFKIDDEQKTSFITIFIYERVKTGLLGKKTTDVEKLKINLVYDYRTGRWSGEDSFGDSDGYGHFRGTEYDIWFNIYQADFDCDGIPYWTEVNVLGTEPTVDDSMQDPDGDGISTYWEWRWGYDPFKWNDHNNLDPDVDGLSNIEEYEMAKWLADPFQPDIYMETDGMEKGPKLIELDHIFYKESQQMVIERFSQHGINVYIDDGWPDGPVNGGGELLPFIRWLDDTNGGQVSAFYQHNFADERKGIFHYVLIVNKGGFCTVGHFNLYDISVCANSLGINWGKPRFFFSQRQIMVGIAKGVMHELGHSIGLQPEDFPGIDITLGAQASHWPSMSKEDYEKYLNEYYSVMNYKYIFGGLDFKARKFVDFSNGENGAPYDQNDWQHLYLPFFQINAVVYEEAVDESFEDAEVIIKNASITSKDWSYSEKLTEQYNKISSETYIENVRFEIKVFVYNGPDPTQKGDIRLYARPLVDPTYALWSLISEGRIDSSNEIHFYSLQDKVDSVFDQIAQNEKNSSK